MAIKYKGQGPPKPKKKSRLKSAISKIKSKARGVKADIAIKRATAGEKRSYGKTIPGMGPNVGIGVSGESPKTHAKAIKKSERPLRKLKRLSKRGVKISKPKGVAKSELSPKGRIRKGAKKVLATKGGAYASYEKGSKAAGSFRKAFKSGCAGGKKSFTWDGRSYSCKKK